MAEPEAIPAATVIVMRDAGAGTPELLMVERAKAMTFAGGALVFPGGRVDPGDRVLAATLDGDPDEVASRIAAARETAEEVGLAVGFRLGEGALPGFRADLHRGMPVGDALARSNGALDLDALIPFARWLPRNVSHKVFDTRFYLAAAPREATAMADGGETVRAFWASAQGVLDLADRGEGTLIFPTRRNLERLACLGSFDAAVNHAAAHPVRTITPWIERRPGGEHLCIPDDAGYPVTAELLVRAIRA